MTNTIKYCSFCADEYTGSCNSEEKSNIHISERGKIMVGTGYRWLGANTPTGDYYNPKRWWEVYDRKPTKTRGKGCKMSHGSCNVCGDNWDRIRRKSSYKSKGWRKLRSLQIKFDWE